MWNHCSLVFHFNWLSTALKPPSTTPLYNCHYLPTTLWTCWTSALRLLTFSTTVNTTNSYTEQLWVHRLLLPKSWCKTARNKPWQVTNEQYHSSYATMTILSQLYTKTKSTIFRQNAHIQFTKEIEDNGKIPFLHCLVSRDNNRLQTTVYRKPTHTDRLLDE